jgi:hypothetical protein
MINTTKETSGRFANHFFRNIAASALAKINNLKFVYSYEREFFNLGINLFKDGSENYSENLLITDENFYTLIKNSEKINKNIYFDCKMYGQTKEFSFYIRDYIYEENHKNHIIEKNLFKSRYNNNNDVFIHVRLGDSVNQNPGYVYYDKVLSQLKFEKGYISSDLISHPLCIALIRKYKLTVINETEVKTIMFASTCKNIVLSNGTFSWVMGLMGFFSKVYYPKIKTIWHGDVFVFPEWNEIDASDSSPPFPYEKALKLMKKYGIKNFS